MRLLAKNILNNNRFYVLLFAFLASIFVVCLLRVQVADDQLYYIQLEQTFGLLCMVMLYLTLIVSPIKNMIGTPEWMKNLIFARRATGVSATYFALLHAGVALWGELGGLSGLGLLPDKFVWPLIYGAAALVILCVLAFISLDKLVALMGYPRWKWLQRWVYLCGILIIMHVWAIGVHFGPGPIRDICLVFLVILFGLESWRIADFLAERRHWGRITKGLFFLIVWCAAALLLGWISLSRPAEAHTLLKDTTGEKGTILHTTPNDDPIAGENTSLIFDIQGAPPGEGQSTANLIVVDEQNRQTQVPARIQGTSVIADYVFPNQGLYVLMLSLQQGGQQTHQFMESQRVSRGVITNATVRSTPLWAGAGLLGTVVVTMAGAVLVFKRRKAISIYSKL